MFSSPMSHFFRHALVSYKEVSDLRKKRMAKRGLDLLEARLLKILKEQPNNQKANNLLGRIEIIKAQRKVAQD